MRLGKIRLLALVLAALSLAACGAKVPEIARDLPTNYAAGEKVFDARLKAKFPAGADVRTLAGTLEAQGFTVRTDDRGGDASFSDKRFPVANVWIINWEAKDGRLMRIWGIYGGRGP